MNEISLRQIKDEARRDAIAAFFAKYKSMIKRAAIVGLISLIFYGIFSLVNGNLQEKYSAILHQSLLDEERGEFDAAKNKLKEIYTTKFVPNGVKSVASMRYASMLLIEGDKINALVIYQNIANSRLNDNYIRDLAALLASKILLIDLNDANQKETGRKIQKFSERASALKPYLLEQMAVFYIKTDQQKEAREVLEKIIRIEDIAQSLKMRALDLIKVLS